MAKLYFYYASMNAGKSTTLLQADFNYRERGMDTMLWTAALDDRYGAGQVTSRIGLIAEAHKFDPDSDIGAAGTVTLRAGLYTVIFPESLLPVASTSCGTLAICV